MPIDPLQARIAVVKNSFMETAAEEYKRSGFTEEECVETIAKQFHTGKKVTRALVHRIYQERKEPSDG